MGQIRILSMPLLQKLRTSEFLASLAQIWLCLNIASVYWPGHRGCTCLPALSRVNEIALQQWSEEHNPVKAGWLCIPPTGTRGD